MMASDRNELGAVRALVHAGALIDKPQKDGTTLLYAATKHGRVEIIKAIAKGGADVNMTFDEGTLLYMASEKGAVEVVQALLGAGADASKAGGKKGTPVLVASHNGHVEVVRALIYDGGANIKTADADGMTPLLVALRNNDVETVRVLVNAGAYTASLRSTAFTSLKAAHTAPRPLQSFVIKRDGGKLRMLAE